MIVEFFTSKIPFPVKELPLMFGLIGVPNLIAVFLFVKVWRSPEEWTLLGHRRRVWQILLSVSFALGITGAVSMAF